MSPIWWVSNRWPISGAPLAGKCGMREIDGHDMGQIVDALDALTFNAEKPSALIAHTVKGKGVSFAENTYV